MGKVRLFCSKGITIQAYRKGFSLPNFYSDVPDPPELLKVKKDSIARFIHVLQPIRDLYQLPSTSVHIFCDLAGSTIAFNRNASIFLNLRYFEAWRTYHSFHWRKKLIAVLTDDDLVRDGELIEAYTSW